MFRNFIAMKSIVLPQNINSIGDGAFCYCTSLTSITIPENVTSIAYLTFRSCTKLTSIEIPRSVKMVSNNAFYECNNLETVNYGGTMEEWNQISIGSNNTTLKNAKIICTDGT